MTTTHAHQPILLAALDPNAIPIPSQILVLLGSSSELHPLVLKSLFVRTQRNERVGIAVGDNRLDAYTLAHAMRQHEYDPASLLSRIAFSRSFTCTQLHHSIVHLVADKIKDWSALYVLGLLETFYDEDVQLSVAARLLNDVLAQLRRLANQGLSILITLAPLPHHGPRSGFIAKVLRAADVYWQPTPEAIERFTAEQIRMW